MRYLLIVFLVSSCSWVPTKETITVEKIVYPELPPVPHVAPLELIPCIPDRPRVWWEPKVVKNTTECKAIPSENCMEYRIDVNSNIVVGYDKDNQNCVALNREKIRYQLKKYQDRLDEINEQRRQWIVRNEQTRK